MPQYSAFSVPLIVTDDDVRRLDAGWAVGVVAHALRAHADGLLAAPARVSADVTLAGPGPSSTLGSDRNGAHGECCMGQGDGGAPSDASMSPGRIVMTAGRTREWFGYRVYDTVDTTRGPQVVVAHDGVTGDVAAIAVGSELGAYRTGALGGVALRALVCPELNAADDDGVAAGSWRGTAPGPPAAQGGGSGGDTRRGRRTGRGATQPVRIAIVGAGRQAWTQLWAAAGVLDIAAVRVASRTAASAEAFCARARHELGIDCAPTASARDAVRGADVVILATTSPTPVIEAAWLEPDCVIVTLGPKQVGRAEFGPDLLDDAFITTDSLEQLHAYDPPSLASQRLPADAVAPLGDVLTGRVEPPTSGRRVHLSVGLAGTEVALLAAMTDVRAGWPVGLHGGAAS